MRPRERDSELADQPEDELTRHAGQDLGPLGSSLEPPVPHPEQRGVRGLGDEALRVDEDRLERPARRAVSIASTLASRFVDLMSHRFQRRSGWLIIATPVSRSRAVGPSS